MVSAMSQTVAVRLDVDQFAQPVLGEFHAYSIPAAI